MPISSGILTTWRAKPSTIIYNVLIFLEQWMRTNMLHRQNISQTRFSRRERERLSRRTQITIKWKFRKFASTILFSNMHTLINYPLSNSKCPATLRIDMCRYQRHPSTRTNAKPNIQSPLRFLTKPAHHSMAFFVQISKNSVIYISSLLKKNKAKKDKLMIIAKACQ